MSALRFPPLQPDLSDYALAQFNPRAKMPSPYIVIATLRE